MIRARCALLTVALLMTMTVWAQERTFDVPALDAIRAIPEFARQAGVQIVAPADELKGVKTPAVKGSLDVRAALKKLLVGTGLEVASDDGAVISLRRTVNTHSAILHFDVPAGELDSALKEFGVQSGVTVVAPTTLTAGKKGTAVRGDLAPADALGRLLKGSGLTFARAADGTIAVQVVASNGPVQASGSDKDLTPKSQLDEILVTGTHIRGVVNSASSIQVYSRADIDASGSTTAQQFFQTLPQNFNGGASEYTIGSIAGGGQTSNSTFGGAPNLRGLGNNATLVLIDGHRVAPADVDGNFVDVSMIPVTAIERIEVVADGASAIYGSDAVGGVINIILRHKFEGVEARAQYGTVESGSRHDTQMGLTGGHEWSGGSALLSYQYSDQTSLSASSHAYSQSLISPYPFDLIPGQVQQAVFATFAQELRQGLNLQGDASYSHRSTSDDFSYGAFYLQTMPAIIDNYSASIGSRIDLPHKSQLALTATYSESDTHNQIFETPSPSPLIQDFNTKSAIISLDANLDGVLVALSSGPVHYALGAQYRQESYGHNNLQTATDQFYPRRHVGAGYVELHIPIIGPKGGSGGEPTLEVTAADREEHYSDFGSTNNPRLGATWRPSSGLQLRGTYGTSFTAPLLYQLNPAPSFVVADRLTDPTQGGSCVFSSQTGQYTGTCTNALEVYGENPQLKPEKAKTWTLGVDFTPTTLRGLGAHITYYSITFSGQIGNAAGAIGNLANALIDEAILGPSIVQRNPPSSVIQRLISTPNYYNFYNVDPASIRVIIDSRDQNLATVTTKGLDVGFSYNAKIPGGQIDTGVNGTRIFSFDDQFISTLAPTEIVNTVFNPVQMRLRARAIMTQKQLTAGVFVNFVGAYSNNLVIPNEHVSSWTTADAFINYDIGSDRGPFRGLSIGLNVTNLTDREPPYVTNPRLAGVPYDGANANPVGRLYSLRIGKRL